MSVFFFGHLGEEFRRRRKIRAERFSKVAIDPGVLFLGRDGEGEDLSFIQVVESHGFKFRQSDWPDAKLHDAGCCVLTLFILQFFSMSNTHYTSSLCWVPEKKLPRLLLQWRWR